MLKLLDNASEELRILEVLNHIKSEANHVILVLDSFCLDIGTVVALPIASPLDSLGFTSSSVTLNLMNQLTSAVAFIHENGVAHLDLKPNNLLVSGTADRPRLIMIDFDVSVFVNSPDTQIEGFVGTPPWVAPEVGTEHGPSQRYSPVRADLWACGQLLLWMASLSHIRDSALVQLARDLSSDDPLQRPLLHKQSKDHLIKAEKHPTSHHPETPLSKRIRIEASSTDRDPIQQEHGSVIPALLGRD